MLKKIIRKFLNGPLLSAIESSYRRGRGLFWQAFYGFPARSMKVIAVTGTNGKSTTCSYINEILKASGLKTAVLTTVYYEVDGQREPNRTHHTIDKQSIVQSFFARARRAKVDWVVLEVTSHALDQDRIMGVPVEIAVVTNLTQDHLDYHGTMEEYARVKSLLLRDYGAKWAVLNTDDEWYEYFKKRSKAEVFSFGKKPAAKGRISSLLITPEGSSAEYEAGKIRLSLKTSLVGEFNLYNASAAASVGLILGLEPPDIERGIESLKNLDGRMEKIEAGQDFTVLVDFGITPDALEQSLKSLRKITKGKVRILFGATGDRDKAKRPLMGIVAAKYADYIYLTDDETYTEDPDTIREAVYAGIKKAAGEGKTEVIPDRLDAIKKALSDARTGDTVLLTGIGHEQSRNMGGKKVPWDERKVVREEIKQLTKI